MVSGCRGLCSKKLYTESSQSVLLPHSSTIEKAPLILILILCNIKEYVQALNASPEAHNTITVIRSTISIYLYIYARVCAYVCTHSLEHSEPYLLHRHCNTSFNIFLIAANTPVAHNTRTQARHSESRRAEETGSLGQI